MRNWVTTLSGDGICDVTPNSTEHGPLHCHLCAALSQLRHLHQSSDAVDKPTTHPYQSLAQGISTEDGPGQRLFVLPVLTGVSTSEHYGFTGTHHTYWYLASGLSTLIAFPQQIN